MNQLWLYISKDDLQSERLQCEQEGKDVSQLDWAFKRLEELDLTLPGSQPAAQQLLDATYALPIKPGFPYAEPSTLEAIRSARPKKRKATKPSSKKQLQDKIHGAWLGRVSGCLLGKPVERWMSPRLWGYLKDTDQYPLRDYISVDAPKTTLKKYEVDPKGWFKENITYMPEDDDTNYTTLGLAIMKKYGRGFTPENVAEAWLQEMPILHTFTAERVAYRNLCLLIQPPTSASHRNVHREWIGAQIRGDFWGYSCPGNPELAAEYAWRDASVSHVKNGIYGEMWAAAMIAHAFTTDNVEEIIGAGLAQIPAECRLAEEVDEMIKWHKEGVTYDDAVTRIHGLWDEKRLHGWCHTISNARIVALALLWGGGDFGDSICKAVQPGFDTDCNGATVGSIMGIIHGASKVPAQWTSIFNDTLETGISGFHRVSIKAMAEETQRLAEAQS
jgi:ADP-ribosylglycohydrolase